MTHNIVLKKCLPNAGSYSVNMDQRWVTLNLHHRQDFLWLIAIQIATIGSLLTAIAGGFHWF
jgi:hypothetical protein